MVLGEQQAVVKELVQPLFVKAAVMEEMGMVVAILVVVAVGLAVLRRKAEEIQAEMARRAESATMIQLMDLVAAEEVGAVAMLVRITRKQPVGRVEIII